MSKSNASKLVAQLLSREDTRLVSGGGDPGHAQNGSPYGQDGTCPNGYVQLGSSGGYTQTCKAPVAI